MSTTASRTIYIDLDDVLCDTAGMYIEIVREEFNKSFKLSDIHSFNLQESFGLNDEENSHMFDRAHSSDFTLSLKPFDNIAPILKEWQRQEYEIAIVTGRHTNACNDSIDWLDFHGIPYDSFTMVDKYSWQDTNHDIAISLDELSGMSFAFAIEDNISMAGHISRSMNTPVLLFDRPWNRSLQTSRVIRRCSSWQEISSASAVYTVDCIEDMPDQQR